MQELKAYIQVQPFNEAHNSQSQTSVFLFPIFSPLFTVWVATKWSLSTQMKNSNSAVLVASYETE